MQSRFLTSLYKKNKKMTWVLKLKHAHEVHAPVSSRSPAEALAPGYSRV